MILWRARIAPMDSGDVQHIVEPDGSLMLPVAGWESPGLPGRPTRNLLTFLDPGLSSERIVFVRVRERLYELHVAPGKDDVLFELVEALTQ